MGLSSTIVWISDATVLPSSDIARGRLRNSDRDATCSLSRSISTCAWLYLAYSSSLTGFSLVMMTGAGVLSGGSLVDGSLLVGGSVMGAKMTGTGVIVVGGVCCGSGTGSEAGSGTKSWTSGMDSAVVSAWKVSMCTGGGVCD